MSLDPWRCRASLAPFRANKTLGIDSYRWILYGDDDTVWFPDVILKLVNRMDHETPYFLTDHIWFPEWKGDSPHGARQHLLNYVIRLRPL